MTEKLKEEFNAARHAEFQITPEQDRKNRVFSLLTMTGTDDKERIREALDDYEVTQEDIDQHILEFEGLRNG